MQTQKFLRDERILPSHRNPSFVDVKCAVLCAMAVYKKSLEGEWGTRKWRLRIYLSASRVRFVLELHNILNKGKILTEIRANDWIFEVMLIWKDRNH